MSMGAKQRDSETARQGRIITDPPLISSVPSVFAFGEEHRGDRGHQRGQRRHWVGSKANMRMVGAGAGGTGVIREENAEGAEWAEGAEGGLGLGDCAFCGFVFGNESKANMPMVVGVAIA
jgi:hypothetical protein